MATSDTPDARVRPALPALTILHSTTCTKSGRVRADVRRLARVATVITDRAAKLTGDYTLGGDTSQRRTLNSQPSMRTIAGGDGWTCDALRPEWATLAHRLTGPRPPPAASTRENSPSSVQHHGCGGRSSPTHRSSPSGGAGWRKDIQGRNDGPDVQSDRRRG